MIILWIVLPAVNFFTWYYVGQSSAPIVGPECDEIYAMQRLSRMTSLQTLLPALPCDNTELENESTFTAAGYEDSKHGIMGYRGCHPIIHPDFEKANVQQVLTADFDSYRSARLAPMIELKGSVVKNYVTDATCNESHSYMSIRKTGISLDS
jgi:hypothetical protein